MMFFYYELKIEYIGYYIRLNSKMFMLESVVNFDSAANCPKSKLAVDSYLEYCSVGNANNNKLAKQIHEDSMNRIAKLFTYKHIELVPGGGTMANRRILDILPIVPKKKNIVLYLSTEHSSMHTIRIQLEARNYRVYKIPVKKNGCIDYEYFQKMIDEYRDNLALVSVQTANNETGVVQDIKRIKSMVECPIHSDAAQAVYLINNTCADIVTFSMYKLGGIPVGILLSNVEIEKLYTGTPDVALVYSTATVLEDYFKNVKDANANYALMKKSFIEKLNSKNIPYINLSNAESVPYIQGVLFPDGVQGGPIVSVLADKGIFISSGSACLSLKPGKGSYVVESMGYSVKQSYASIRISFGNAKSDKIDLLVDSIYEAVVAQGIGNTNFSLANNKRDIVANKKMEITCGYEHMNYQTNTALVIYGEIVLRGKNKKIYSRTMTENICEEVSVFGASVEQSYVSSLVVFEPEKAEVVTFTLASIPGIAKIIPGYVVRVDNVQNVVNRVANIVASIVKDKLKDVPIEFKVRCNIRDRKLWYNHTTNDWNIIFGQYIVDNFGDGVKVMLKKPELVVVIELTDKYVVVANESETITGLGGLPLGKINALCVVNDENVEDTIEAVGKMATRGVKFNFIADKLSDRSRLGKICYKPKFVGNDNLESAKLVLEEPHANRSVDRRYFSVTEFDRRKHRWNSALMLLSGGIDSPVASFKLLEAGMKVDFIHYTIDIDRTGAVRKLYEILKNKFENAGDLYIVEFKSVQDKVKDTCGEQFNNYRTLMYKVLMVEYANKLADTIGSDAIGTGNAIGQVASQSVENVSITRIMSRRPIVSPLIAYNKDDIIKIAKDIGTYTLSTCEGGVDCCVLYLPKHPVIKGNLSIVKKIRTRIGDLNSIKIVNVCQKIDGFI